MKKLPKVYAGIGSRRTPADIQQLMSAIAYDYAKRDVTLRSGHAPGADKAFERGAFEANGKMEIYLPWFSFEGGVALDFLVRSEPSERAMEIASEFHPAWTYLTHGVKKLIARNTHQVLGEDCESPCDLVVCWTPDASVDGKGTDTGGTGQALRIAHAHAIPVFNLCDDITRQVAESNLAML